MEIPASEASSTSQDDEQLVLETTLRLGVSGSAMAARVEATPAGTVGRIRVGLVDSGTTDHVMRHDAYLAMLQAGLVGAMQAMAAGTMHIMFGKEGNEEAVISTVHTNTPLGNVRVVQTMGADMLISEREYAAKQAYIIKDDKTIAVIQHGRLVLFGTRDPTAEHGDTASLWVVDLRSVFLSPGVEYPLVGDDHADATLRKVIDDVRKAARTVFEEHEESGIRDSAPDGVAEVARAFKAKPEYTGAQVRAARQLIWASNNMSGHTLARTLEANAWHNAPAVDPKLLKDLASRRDNVAHIMTHDTRRESGGSGIREERPGKFWHADVQGQWKPGDAATLAQFVMIMTCDASGYTVGIPLDGKKEGAYGILAVDMMLRSAGRTMEHISFDKASEVGVDYIARLNRDLANVEDALPENLLVARSGVVNRARGIRVTKQPAEAYEKHVEAHWRTILKDFANALLSQNTLKAKDYWVSCILDCINRRNCVVGQHDKTPFELMFGRTPDAATVFQAPFGALVVCRHVRGNTSGLAKAVAPAYDLAVYLGSPAEQNKVSLVLRSGKSKPEEATDIRPLEPIEIRRTSKQWSESKVVFTSSGRIETIPEGVEETFTQEDVIRRFQDLRAQGQQSALPSDLQRAVIERHTGRMQMGGTTTSDPRLPTVPNAQRAAPLVPMAAALEQVAEVHADATWLTTGPYVGEAVVVYYEHEGHIVSRRGKVTRYRVGGGKTKPAYWNVEYENSGDNGNAVLDRDELRAALQRARGGEIESARLADEELINSVAYVQDEDAEWAYGLILSVTNGVARLKLESGDYMTITVDLVDDNGATHFLGDYLVNNADLRGRYVSTRMADGARMFGTITEIEGNHARIEWPNGRCDRHEILTIDEEDADNSDSLWFKLQPLEAAPDPAPLPVEAEEEPEEEIEVQPEPEQEPEVDAEQGPMTEPEPQEQPEPPQAQQHPKAQAAPQRGMHTRSKGRVHAAFAATLAAEAETEAEEDDDQLKRDADTAFLTSFGKFATDQEADWAINLWRSNGPQTTVDMTHAWDDPVTAPGHLHRRPATTYIRPDSDKLQAQKATGPKYGQIKRDPELQKVWQPLMHKYNEECITSGKIFVLTKEEAERIGLICLPHLRLCKVKADGTLKYRHTPDGSFEDKRIFDNLYADGIDATALRMVIAMAAHYGMRLEQADVQDAYPSKNLWADPANKRTRPVGGILEPFESGHPQPLIFMYLTVTNGLRDAPTVFRAILTRRFLEFGLQRSTVCQSIFYLHDPRTKQLLLIVAVYVDDTLKAIANNEAGRRAHQQLMDFMLKAGLDQRHHVLEDTVGGKGLTFTGINIRRFANDIGTGLAISQPQQAVKVAEMLAHLGCTPTEPVWTPAFKEWTEEASTAHGDTRSEQLTRDYLSLLGRVAYQMLTGMTHPCINLLAKQARAPTRLDMAALVQAAQCHQVLAKIPITLYRNKEVTDTTQPMEIHADTDAGECRVLDGGGRGGLIVRVGPRGFPGGYVLAESKAVEQSASTPGDEAWMLGHGAQTVMVLRHLLQELAGLQPNAYDTRVIVPGRAAPSSFATRADTAEDLHATDRGTTGCPVQTLVAKWFRAGHHSLDADHPTDINQDSEVVGEVVVKRGDTKRLRGLRSYLRIFRLLWQAIADQHITVTTRPSALNAANGLTKVPAGPLAFVRSLVSVLGDSEELRELVAVVEARHSKKRGHTESEEVEQDGEAFAAKRVTTAVRHGVGCTIPDSHWLERTSTSVRTMVDRLGYATAAADLRAHPHAAVPIQVEVRRPADARGVGLAAAAFAAQLHDSARDSKEKATRADFTRAYELLQLPCPEREAALWNSVVTRNTERNSNQQFTERMEELLHGETAHPDAARTAIMVWAATSQAELAAVEVDKEAAWAAVRERRRAAAQQVLADPDSFGATSWWHKRRAMEARCAPTSYHFSMISSGSTTWDDDQWDHEETFGTHGTAEENR